MSRSHLPLLALLTGALLAAASPGLAQSDPDEEQRLAKQWLAAVEKYDERQEAVIKHGRRAELALTILQQEQAMAELDATIRDMNTVIASFPPRRWWIKDQHDYYQLKVAHDAQRNAMHRELTDLRFQERQLYEEEMRRAEAQGRPVKPFHREAILQDAQRLNREAKEAFAVLKEGIEAAARKQHTTRGVILDGLKTTTPRDVAREFLPKFLNYAGGDAWLAAGAEKPPQTKPKADEKKAPPKVDNEASARTWLRMGDNLKAKNAKAAREWYEKIIRTCPDTGAAKEARSRLKDLNSR
jgi:hypothetical protein